MPLADSYDWLGVEDVAVTYDTASDAAMEGGDLMVSLWIFAEAVLSKASRAWGQTIATAQGTLPATVPAQQWPLWVTTAQSSGRK